MEQIVAVPDLHSIPQEQTSERIQEPIVDAERGTSSSAAVRLDTAECPIDGFFRTFPQKKKNATTRRESSANLAAHSSSSTPQAYDHADDDRWFEEQFRRHYGPNWRDIVYGAEHG